jgi:hypothetical protein
MDRCPPEVIHAIFGLLEFPDVSALRRTSRKYATVGLEYLTNTVSLFLTQESINRAKSLVNHPVIRQHITSLLFEGYMVADVGCAHNYATHWGCCNCHEQRPTPPEPGASARERRLHQRNLAKFEKHINEQYQRHRALYDEQQVLINSPAYATLGRDIAQVLPKLVNLNFRSAPPCFHHLSDRFRDMISGTSLVLKHKSRDAVTQLASLLLPGGTPLLNLKLLQIDTISPAFFAEASQPVLNQVFTSLQSIRIMLRLSSQDEDAMSDDQYEGSYSAILGESLNEALASARGLENLAINIDDDWSAPGIKAQSILGDTTWPKLKRLDLDFCIADEEYLASAFQRHASTLEHLNLVCVKLTSGDWRSMIDKLRKLDLTIFGAGGVFEDNHDLYILPHCNVDAFFDSELEITLAQEICTYVTEGLTAPRDHPLDNVFQDIEELREELNAYADFSDDED